MKKIILTTIVALHSVVTYANIFWSDTVSDARFRNMWSIAPFYITMDGFGPAVRYQRSFGDVVLLDISGIYSIQSGRNAQGAKVTGKMYTSELSVLFSTGFTGVKFAIGPTIVAGSGLRRSYDDVFSGGPIVAKKVARYYFVQRKVVIGAMLTGSLYVFATKHLTFSGNISLGSTQYYTRDGKRDTNDFLFHMGALVGYRW